MDEVAVSTDMPRERLLLQGAQALADYELLAVLLRTGSKGSNVLEFSRELLRARGGLVGLFNSRAADLQGGCAGLGKGKRRAGDSRGDGAGAALHARGNAAAVVGVLNRRTMCAIIS